MKKSIQLPLHITYNNEVDSATQDQLLEVNKTFYQTFAEQFSATRQRLQPGVQRILEAISPHDRILDLGCGNGELARNLAINGHRGLYVGLDMSPKLLENARESIGPVAIFPFYLIQADLSASAWEVKLPASDFSYVLALAVLHHLPGKSLRVSVLKTIHQHLQPDGRFIHSEWQFLNSPRLKARLQPWEVIGLSDHQVEDGDYLLDWRHGGLGFRYVHHFSSDELSELADEAGFSILETFLSDGENGRLGLYQVWERKSSQ